jgi:ABC-type Fe3+-citrate transport system substrate-binding protein
MKIEAKLRLIADAESSAKESLDRQIEQKKKQIENLKQTLPSKTNKTAISPARKIQIEKNINRAKGDILNLKQRKET